MKKFLKSLCVAILIISAICMCSCKETQSESNYVYPVVIVADSGVCEITSTTTLGKYMQKLQISGCIDYVSNNGMYEGFLNKNNDATTNTYWMLYTDDAEFGDETWGVFDYGNKKLLSATVGADQLIVKQGCYYVWVYKTM